MKKSQIINVLFVGMLAALVVWAGYRDWRKSGLVRVDNQPMLYAPIFYNADSLYFYMDKAYHGKEDAEAFAIVGTAAYNLRVFDKPAFDSLPAVELEEADMMLWRAAELQFEPAALVIHYLDQMGLWHHSIPDCPIPEHEKYQPLPDYKKL